MPTVIVTGSGGLIGTEAASHFARAGYDVIGVENDMRARFFGPDASTAHTTQRLLEELPNFRVEALDIRDAEGILRLFERVGSSLEAVVHTAARQSAPAELLRDHDRDTRRLLPEDDPVFRALGLSDHQGRMKPSRQSKYRQVEEFLRILDASISDALDKGHLRRPTAERPLEIVDLGCGNAYLTFVTERFLSSVRDLPVHLTGIDQREQSREHNQDLARELGVDATFVASSIAGADPTTQPDVVLALHACDTATDDALARAIEWGTPLVLAAPCCHHDIAAQLRKAPTPAPYAMLTRHGILRERFADTLTDGLRASLLRLQGYRVDVMQFVGSEHTPRNTLLRAVRTGKPVTGGSARQEYDELVATWGVRPRLGELLDA